MSSKTVETRAHTTKDGRLKLSVDVDVADADAAVAVTVTPVAGGSGVDENGWPRASLTASRARCQSSAAGRKANSKSGLPAFRCFARNIRI